ncbi:MAG: VWA domain-containing protein [Lentisphaerae bacterium]|nr:VWA domain-containing protein [Lentisphaerota bacterium]
MSLSFANPWMLMLLWLVPGMGVWWYAAARRRARNLAVFVSPTMQARLQPRHAASRLLWQSILLSLGLLLMLFAASRPRWGVREQMVFKRGRDLVIALDVSRSMLAADVYPNRLERAKVDLIDLIQELEGDRAALIAFRHTAILLCPLTTDYAYLKQALDRVTIDSAPRGETDIGDAIAKSLDAFESEDSSHKAIILISDGEDLTGRGLALAGQAAERGIPIFTVGLGDARGARIPDADQKGAFARHKGSEIVSKLDNETLDKIAQISGGAYVPVGTASTASTTLGGLYRNRLSHILEQDLEETLQQRHVERYQMFLLPAFLLFLAGACLSRGRLSKGSRKTEVGGRRSEVRDMSPPKSPLKDISVAAAVLLAIGIGAAPTVVAQTTNAIPLGPSPLATTSSPPSTLGDPTADLRLPTSDVPPGRSGARMAQTLYRKKEFAKAAAVYEQAAQGSTRESQRDFMFNAAVAWYQAGEYVKAATILQRLVQSRHQADLPAAEGLGASLYRQAEIMDGAVDADTLKGRQTMLHRSAGAYQEALRAAPESEDDRANLALLLKALPAANEQLLVARLMQEHGQTEPFDLLETMLTEQRHILEVTPQIFTNDTPAQIAQYEAIAARQKANGQLWIPLKGKLLGMMQQAPQDQLAMMNGAMDNIQDSMMDASAGFRDLDPAAYGPAADAESNLYGIWKQMADYQLILMEDVRRQSNAVAQTEMTLPTDQPPTARNLEDQAEALALTPLFLERLPEPLPANADKLNPVDEAGQPIPGAVKPEELGLSVEVHSNVVALATEAIDAQQLALKHLQNNRQVDALDEEMRSYNLLKQIEALMPKSENQQQQQQPKDQPQEQPQDQDKPQDQEQPPQDEQSEEQPPKEEEPQPQQQEEREMSGEELSKLLDRALEREKEYEEQKRSQNRSIPLSPRDRDW